MKKLIAYLVILSITALSIQAQSRTITGTVSDEQGTVLEGVIVNVKGTNVNTLSNYKGEYSIQISSTSTHLLFSLIGFESREVKISGRSIIDVILKSTQLEMEFEFADDAEEAISAPAMDKVSYSSAKKHMRESQTMYFAGSARPDNTQVQWNTEGYSTIHENGYKNVIDAPLSTFSIDVDKASYSNVRRYLNSGQMPPKDAVRIEEMINYFSYDYPEPKDEHPFSVTTELSVCPWNTGHQLLHVGLKGMDIDKGELPASNLVFLIDVSGSMSAQNKLGLLKPAFTMLVNQLRAEDKVSIVVYAGAAGLVLEPTSGKNKEKILAAIEKLSAGGSTAGGAGLALAYKTASENFVEDGNNRIILATDGDFNVGASSNAEMERMIEKEREKGIYMTVLGFGMGNYKDDKMEIIADKGNGNYAYIDNIQEARKVLVNEFGGTLFTIAKDVKFQLEFNPQRVKAYRLIGYENRILNDEDFNDDKKDAGEMGAGHTVTALYEIIPAGSDEGIYKIDPLKYQEILGLRDVKPNKNAELLTIKLRYKKPDGFKSILIERPVQGEILDKNELSDNFRFSAAVAEFGLILRDSEFKANARLEQVVKLAISAKGEDEEGYRAEFITLVKSTSGLAKLEN
ncbi:MAG: von Willebrand factor type A domain-containing protein [Bacteroidales bacterium]|nr:von Willebrand factor type A domain-containing protein [Bacteroidales bacterium]MCF8390962.1 von Willebrand factor type A domain-containing protein [Bacteroidales bacterium]